MTTWNHTRNLAIGLVNTATVAALGMGFVAGVPAAKQSTGLKPVVGVGKQVQGKMRGWQDVRVIYKAGPDGAKGIVDARLEEAVQRVAFGCGSPTVTITDAHRGAPIQAPNGTVATKSMHLQVNYENIAGFVFERTPAVDFRTECTREVDIAVSLKVREEMGLGGLGCYKPTLHLKRPPTHLDLGKKRSWGCEDYIAK